MVTSACPDFAAEVAEIIEFVRAADDSRSTCLVTRTHRALDSYDAALREAGIATFRISRRQIDQRDAPGVRLATMHRVKGLEFDRMILAGINEGTVPLLVGDARSTDRGVRAEAELRERALFYVASTRARRDLLVTSNGRPSPWIRESAELAEATQP